MSETVDQPQIHKVHTSCKGCYFSLWKDKTQTGCSLRLIDKFKEKSEIIEVFDEVGDEFYVINDRNCQFKRPEVWGHRFSKNHDNAYKWARKENTPRVDLIIYIDKLDAPNLDRLHQTLKSIDDSKVGAIKIVNNSLEDPSALSIQVQRSAMTFGINQIPRTLKHVIEADASYQRCCDMAVKESKAPYFLVCKVGFKFPAQKIHELDVRINEKLEPFSLLEFDEDTYMSSTFLYKMVGGNVEKPFIEKIKEIAKEEESEDMILYG